MASTSSGTPLYRHRKNLFVVNGKPMKFRMIPCSERQKIKGLIEHGGGTVSSVFSEGCIRLAPPDTILHTAETVSTEFIFHCVAANKVLDSKKFKLPQTVPVKRNDDDDDHASDRFLKSSKGKAQRKITKLYTKDDDDAILKYIEMHNKFHLIKGNAVWQEMLHKKVTSHSWQSMRNRLLRYIGPNLANYRSVSENFKKRLADHLNISYTITKNGNSSTSPANQNKCQQNCNKNASDKLQSEPLIGLRCLRSTKSNILKEPTQKNQKSLSLVDHELPNNLPDNVPERCSTRRNSVPEAKNKQDDDHADKLKSTGAVIPSDNALQEVINDNVVARSELWPEILVKRCVNPSETTSMIKIQLKTGLQKSTQKVALKKKNNERHSSSEPLSDSSESWSKASESFHSSGSNSSHGNSRAKKPKLCIMNSSDVSESTSNDLQRRVTRSSVKQCHARNLVSTPINDMVEKPSEIHNVKDLYENGKSYSSQTNGGRKRNKPNRTDMATIKRKLKSTAMRQSVAYFASSDSSLENLSDSESRIDSVQNTKDSLRIDKITNKPALIKSMSRKLPSSSDSDISNASTVVCPYSQSSSSTPPPAQNGQLVINYPSNTDFSSKSNSTAKDDCNAPVLIEHTSDGNLMDKTSSSVCSSNVKDDVQHDLVVANVHKPTSSLPTVKNYSSGRLEIPHSKIDISENSGNGHVSSFFFMCKSNARDEIISTHLLSDMQTPKYMVLETEADNITMCNSQSATPDIVLLTDDCSGLRSSLEITGTSSSSDTRKIELSDDTNDDTILDPHCGYDVKLRTHPSFEKFEIPQSLLSPEEIMNVSQVRFSLNYLLKFFGEDEILDGQTRNYAIDDVLNDIEALLSPSNALPPIPVETLINKKCVATQVGVIGDVLKECSFQTEAIAVVFKDQEVQFDSSETDCGKSIAIQTDAIDHGFKTSVLKTECNTSIAIQTEFIPGMFEDCAIQTDNSEANCGKDIAVCQDCAIQTDESKDNCSQALALCEDCAIQTDIAETGDGVLSYSTSVPVESYPVSSELHDDDSQEAVIYDCPGIKECGLFSMHSNVAKRVIENAICEDASSTKISVNDSLIICDWLSKSLNLPVQNLKNLLHPNEEKEQVEM